MNVRVALLQIASQHTKSGQRGVAGCPGIPGQIKSVWVAGSPRNTQLMDNPLLGSISTREALNAMKAIIAESKVDGERTIKLVTLNDIKSNLSVFMRYCVREEYSDSNPFIGLDITDLGADETVSSYVPFAKDQLQQRKGQSGKVLLCPQQDYLATSVVNF